MTPTTRIPEEPLTWVQPELSRPDGLCVNCKERPATLDWVGEMGVMALTHGWASRWCERCAVVAQIAYAKERAASLPGLEQRLAELDSEEAP